MSLYGAGAARVDLTPPAGLPMVGFVRQWQRATGTGRLGLEATAMVLEADGARAVLCGVDTVGIQAPVANALVARVAEACGADPSAVVLSWNHTHLAPANGFLPAWMEDGPGGAGTAAVETYGARLLDAVEDVCARAARTLVPATVRWAVGEADVCVNRRERRGAATILGWNPALPVDRSVTALVAETPAGEAVATAVTFGCHPVCAGWDVLTYSADYPGALRAVVRGATGGECVFLQGAGGNVLPRYAFTGDEDEAVRTGRAVGLAALAALERGRDGGVAPSERRQSGSVTPIALYRRAARPAAPAVVAAAATALDLPLLPLPTVADLDAEIGRGHARLEAERAAGDDPARIATILYDLRWAESARAEIAAGSPRTAVRGPVHALRIGGGILATGPGEVFTEIGLAVKERSPAPVTAYAGYANGLVSYLPTAAEYPHGGYEPGYGNRTFGLPAQVTPACEALLVEAAVRLAEGLVPDAAPWPASAGWTHTGATPAVTPATAYPHPDGEGGPP